MKKLLFKIVLMSFCTIFFVNCGSDDEKTKTEICDNGLDDDNNGFTDCEDIECVCEICDNGIDDDNDGFIDSEDADCTI